MLKFGKSKRKSPEVSVIPVINVVFLLLVFFITQGSLKKVDPVFSAPVSSSGKAVGAKVLEITIDQERILIGTEVISESELKTTLTDMARTDPDREVLLKADANLDSIRLLEVLKIIRKAEINNLYMVTLPPL